MSAYRQQLPWVLSVGPSPVQGGNGLRRAVQILLELQLEGLADGADDTLCQTIAALQDVAGWENGGQGWVSVNVVLTVNYVSHDATVREGRTPTSLIDRIFSHIGHIIRCVLKTNSATS